MMSIQGDMARRRFFVPQVRRGVAELTGEDAEHLVRVLRAEVDEVYEISDNEDLYLARITVARKSVVSFEVIEQLSSAEPAGRLMLVAALFKFDRFEWLVEKATEIGVAEIVPFEAVRTERGLAQAAVKRRARWERIGLEASQQARRVRLPVVREATRFEEAASLEADCKIFLDEEDTAPSMWRLLEGVERTDAAVAVMVGPEGGWTDGERARVKDTGWSACSLGPTILRAETAGVAGLAIARVWLDR